MNDLQKLKEYIRSGDEAGFEGVVKDYLPLVYSTALRLVNRDTHLAQDVAQLVFLNLAQKASTLPESVVLAGWLHRDTRYTALELLRKEKRRRAREAMAEDWRAMDRNESTAEWEDVSPILDDALNALPDKERDVLLLRFFQKLSVREVGARLGIGESGASRRISAAVENLKRVLSKDGVVVSSAVLAGMLSIRTIEAVPASAVTLAWAALRTVSSIPAGAAATAISIPQLFFVMSTNVRVALLGIGLGALLVGGVAWKARVHRLESITGSTPQAPDGVVKLTAKHAAIPLREPELTGSRSAAVVSTNPALAKIRAILYAKKRIAQFPPPELREAIDELGKDRKAALPLLVEALRDKDLGTRHLALCGLEILNGDAREAIPNILELLRTGTNETEGFLAIRCLESMGRNPKIIPDLSEAMKVNRAARVYIANSISSLVEPGSEEAAHAADFFRPLLNDPDSSLAAEAGRVLAMIGDTDERRTVLASALTGLQSEEEDAQLIALGTVSRLKEYGTNAIPGLRAYLSGSHRPDLKLTVSKLLSELDPSFLQQRSAAGFREQQKKLAAALIEKIQTGSASSTELIQALGELPEAIPSAAGALASIGFERLSREDPRRLSEAVIALNVIARGDFPIASRFAANRAYAALQPTRPRPIYSSAEIANAFQSLRSEIDGLPSNERSRAEGLLEWFGGQSKHVSTDVQLRPGDVAVFSSDTISSLMRGLEEIDRRLANRFTSEIRKVDRNFR